MYEETCYEELAHMIVAPGKSHDLLSASWTPRKARGVIQSESKDLRSRETYSVNPSPRTREGEVGCPGSTTRQKKGDEFLLLPPFVLFGPSVDWMMSTHFGEGSLLSH